MPDPTVVVGASLAGIHAVAALRRAGEDGRVVVIGAENRRPYDRPPLSKRVLTAGPASDPEDLTTLGVADDLDVEWRLATAATGLDLDRRRVTVEGGEEVAYDRLVVATGAGARTLAAAGDLDRVHVLRTLDDAISLKASLAGGPSVAVVGAGFIGLEVASSCHELGLAVTVIEALAVPLLQALGPVIGARIADRHRRAGIHLETGAGVASLVGGPGVEALRLTDGRTVEADVVVVGVGVTPAVGWLAGSGVDLDDGLVCDSRLRVLAGGRPVPGVVAAGDVARWAHPAHPSPIRVEHWTNAVEQGEAAAATLLHGEGASVFAPIPYFWSDQLGAKLQMVGSCAPGDDVTVVDDAGDGVKWVAAYGRAGRVVAAVGSSRPAKIMALRREIDRAGAYSPEL